MTHRLIPIASSPCHLALAILLVGAVRAPAQEQSPSRGTPGSRPSAPATAPSASARAWSGYRPGTAWGPSHHGLAPAVRSTVGAQAPARVHVSQSGWPKYTPSSAWTGYRQATPYSPVAPHAPVYVSQSGWATYAPSSAWTGYRLGAGWQSYEPAAARPMNMRQAHVSGPSPYADGLARSYREYGTGRPVPLAKPWLPGSP